MIWILGMLVIGASLGVLTASAYVPRVRVLPMVGVFVLLACVAIWPGIQLNQELTPWLSFAATLSFILAMAGAGSLYAASLWVVIFPEAQLTYWQFVSRDLTRPNYLRQQYAAMLAEATPSEQP
ncbi:hypothetical protein [Rhodoglobus sp.]